MGRVIKERQDHTILWHTSLSSCCTWHASWHVMTAQAA